MAWTQKIPGSIRAVLLGAGLLFGMAASSLAQEAPDEQVIGEGKSDFEWQCSACHGSAIAKANGGKFPFWRVYRVIAGKTHVPGHETFQMPDFWKRFSGDEKEWGFLPPHVRVLELTHYIESIQEK